MKLLATFILTILCATASAQTIKTLGYNTTNGQIAYTGTNALTLTNKLVLPLDANHTSVTAVALQISTNSTGFFVGQGPGNPLTAAHNGVHGWAVTTNVIIAYKPLRYNSTAVGSTNAPTNTTTPAAWIEVQVGTTSYRVPLYQ